MRRLPDTLSSLDRLTSLNVRGFFQQFPDVVCRLPALRHLRIKSHEEMRGVLPDDMGNLQKLTSLELELVDLPRLGGSIGGQGTASGTQAAIPPETEQHFGNLGQLTSLRILRIRVEEGDEKADMPPELGMLTNLRVLDLGRNRALEQLPANLGLLTNLRELHLNQCKALKALPPSVGDLIKLEVMVLAVNPALTELPESINRLSSLTELNLDRSPSAAQWIASHRDVLASLTSLRVLDFENCELDSIPGAIGTLTEMRLLRLGFNNIESLPDSIGSLTRLVILSARNNRLSSIPDSIGGLVLLRVLDLDNNQLEKLPPSVRGLRRLQTLNVGGNKEIRDVEQVLPGKLRRLTTTNSSGRSVTVPMPGMTQSGNATS